MILVTGAAGFIGSSFVKMPHFKGKTLIAVDSLTYAGHLPNLFPESENPQFLLSTSAIGDYATTLKLLQEHGVNTVVNFAAESHVDNSINGPEVFVQTNVVGTFRLLEAARHYFQELSLDAKKNFRLLHVSTDEVFGELGKTGKFSETTSYDPSSPYSATKAASDHLVRAWHKTYGLPTIVTNCSNNYGPRQFPEKLIPRMILCALNEQPLPVYGRGENIRDWIHVEDHCQGIWLALTKGTPGETYCFGGNSERRNIDVVTGICQIMDELKPRANGKSYRDLITFVEDRLGHDWRYAIDDSKAQRELGFNRKFSKFEDGLKETVKWYLDNPEWIQSVLEKGSKK
ncbi:MAG: dTDP-glucose 4,6-dehydratase [Bdellovibrionales bacterium]|nr:dTDP-glucose 4,6-dehydratase [Bdellovibrionales bacterium]